MPSLREKQWYGIVRGVLKRRIVCKQDLTGCNVQRHLALFVVFAMDHSDPTPLAKFRLSARQCAEFSCGQSCVKEQHNDCPISQISRLRHGSHERLFFLIIEITGSGNFLSDKLDDLCWIVLDLPCGE